MVFLPRAPVGGFAHSWVMPFPSAADAACRGGLIHFLSPLLILVKARTSLMVWHVQWDILVCQYSPCSYGLLKLALSIFS